MKNTNKITGTGKIITTLSIVTLAVAAVGLSACKKKEEDATGPMEELGKKMDEKLDKVGEKIDEQADKVEKKIEDVGKEIEKGANKVKEKVADGADKVSKKLRDEPKENDANK
ncbi:MAG: hypothetical protein GXP30_02140 [Verrucomicrobia bacterium]|nr:hypothetical protein [Verrucomicrobiota bacterium]